MAIRGLLLGRDQGDMKGFNHQVMGDVHYYGLAAPPDFVTAPSQWKVFPGDQELFSAMKDPGFDPATQVFFSQAPPPALTAQLTGQKSRSKL